MVAVYKPSKTVKYSPSYMVRPTDRPMRREPQKICENFALKVLIFPLFQLVTERIYKTMTERNFVVLKQKENFILKTEKSFHVQNLEKIAEREIFAKEKKEENFAEI